MIKNLTIRIRKLEDNKLEKVVFEELKERFDIFSEVETIKTLRERFLPRIESFTKLIDSMEANMVKL